MPKHTYTYIIETHIHTDHQEGLNGIPSVDEQLLQQGG